MNERPTISVLGAGAWGTALANLLAHKGHDVALWARDPAHVQEMRASGYNARRLPGVKLAASLAPTEDFASAVSARVVLACAPAQNFRALARAAREYIGAGAHWVLCAKGVERGSHAFMSEVLAQEAPQARPAILSGPSFAADLAFNLPTAVTLAAPTPEESAFLCALIGAPHFRLYRSTDILGAEIGGAGKNVLAIACGAAAGQNLGASAGAALIARGFAELSRFGVVMGAQPETLMGLSGLGDVVLSCASTQSRNFAFGYDLGKGALHSQAGGGKLAEGAFTARALVELASARGVDMPICAIVDQLVAGEITVQRAIESLMARPLKAEI